MIRPPLIVLMALAQSGPTSANDGLRYPYTDAQLFDRGEMRTYTGEHLEAVSFPVGGVGAGAVHIDGRGVRHAWTIFPRYWLANDVPGKPAPRATHLVRGNKRVAMTQPKNLPYYMSYVPDSFFAVRVAADGGEPLVRVLQTVGEAPFKPVSSLRMRGAYPLAWYEFRDDALAAKVSMRTWNPLIPLDVRDSAMPCAIYDLTAENPTDRPVTVSFLATQQNAAGLTGTKRTIDGVRSGGRGRNINRIERRGGVTTLRMTTDIPKDALGYGQMALATNAPAADAIAEWYDPKQLFVQFAGKGGLGSAQLAGPTKRGTVNGALARTFTLPPGEQKTVTFVLSWHFPNAIHGGGKLTGDTWTGRGNRYANWWPDAVAVARDVLARYDRLQGRTLAYQQSLYETNLPYWFLDRISSQVAPIRTRTVWWAEDGYFGAWEGMGAGTGSCGGNCNHVWHYAQAYARLFPSLARTMREQDYAFPRPDGGLPYRQPSESCPVERRKYPAADGQLGVVLATYREYLTSTDAAWLKRTWPSARGAMQFVIATWDADRDGSLDGVLHTTLDCKVGGSTSWLGSMYLAALRACERMARVAGDDAGASRYRKIAAAGCRKQAARLFNGTYFIQRIAGKPEDLDDYYTLHGFRPAKRRHPAFLGGQNYFDGCAIDQLLGQWWAWQLDLGWLYPKDHVRSALRSLYTHNYFPTFADFERPRVPWVDPRDGGMVVLTFPRGRDERLRGKKVLGYDACTLTGFEYAAAAAMVRAGLLREGFTVVRTVSDRYDGRLRTGLHRTAWGYSGNPFGDDESGKWYARAQSAWSLLLAAQGFIYDGPAGVIGFDPVWRPEDHRSFFTAARGVGVFTQKRRRNGQICTMELRDGTLTVRRMVLYAPDSADVTTASMTHAGRRVPATVVTRKRGIELILREAITLGTSESVQVELKWTRW